MILKPSKTDQASALVDCALRKRKLAEILMNEAEADLAQAKKLFLEVKHEESSRLDRAEVWQAGGSEVERPVYSAV